MTEATTIYARDARKVATLCIFVDFHCIILKNMAPQSHNENPSDVLNVHPMVIVVAGTLIVVLVAIVVFIVLWKKTKLNW